MNETEQAQLDSTDELLDVITNPASIRRDVAEAYERAIARMDPVEWGIVNRAIVRRWSVSGLETIKREAWALRSRRG